MNLILLSFITLLINYIASSVFVINTCDCPSSLIPFSKKLGFAFINTSHAVTVGCLALGIKFLKNWYLRQKENYALTKQRLLKESQLKKANIYPSFLFRSLDKLYQKIISNSTDASTIILTLSDLLSHILYECKDEWVLLEKELLIVSELVNLEKVNEAGKWQIELTTSGSVANKYIPSLLLFSLLQRCLIEMDKGSIEANISKLKIDIYSDELFLIFTMSINMQLNIRSSVWSELLEETYQKLKLLYNNNFQFDYKISNNGLLLSLKMPLYDKVQENLIESDTEQKKIIYESA
ncbi:MAG: histidine kinase [Bacteroidota bacterium]